MKRYEQSEYRPVESRHFDKGKRQEVLRRIKSKGPNFGQGGQGVYQEINQELGVDSFTSRKYQG